MANRLLERLADGPPLVADGGMGVLVSSAVPRVRIPEEANLRAPETVVKLHVGFIQAGADVIETNTFGANRRKLAANYLEDELHAINSTGVKLAREAREISGRDVFIAGSIGPLGEPGIDPDLRREIFAEQAAVLEGRGVDLFAVETFFELDELESRSKRFAASLPSRARHAHLRRRRGDALRCLGRTRCGTPPRARRRRDRRKPRRGHPGRPRRAQRDDGNGLPLAAMPNIGLASMAGNRDHLPARLARVLRRVRRARTEPRRPGDRRLLRDDADRDRGHRLGGQGGARASAPLVFAEREVQVAVPEQREETELARAFREHEWVVSVQIDPPLGGSYAGMIDVAQRLKQSGNAGFVDINDNATARAAASALMLAIEIERSAAVETIPHLTTRDATIMGLESQLLGAHACGIRNVLSVTGDPPEVGDYPGSRGVYEIDSIGLTHLMARLNRGEDYNGRAIDAAHVVPHRGRGQPGRRRPRRRSSTVSTARSKPARTSR